MANSHPHRFYQRLPRAREPAHVRAGTKPHFKTAARNWYALEYAPERLQKNKLLKALSTRNAARAKAKLVKLGMSKSVEEDKREDVRAKIALIARVFPDLAESAQAASAAFENPQGRNGGWSRGHKRDRASFEKLP